MIEVIVSEQDFPNLGLKHVKKKGFIFFINPFIALISNNCVVFKTKNSKPIHIALDNLLISLKITKNDIK